MIREFAELMLIRALTHNPLIVTNIEKRYYDVQSMGALFTRPSSLIKVNLFTFSGKATETL